MFGMESNVEGKDQFQKPTWAVETSSPKVRIGMPVNAAVLKCAHEVMKRHAQNPWTCPVQHELVPEAVMSQSRTYDQPEPDQGPVIRADLPTAPGTNFEEFVIVPKESPNELARQHLAKIERKSSGPKVWIISVELLIGVAWRAEQGVVELVMHSVATQRNAQGK